MAIHPKIITVIKSIFLNKWVSEFPVCDSCFFFSFKIAIIMRETTARNTSILIMKKNIFI